MKDVRGREALPKAVSVRVARKDELKPLPEDRELKLPWLFLQWLLWNFFQLSRQQG